MKAIFLWVALAFFAVTAAYGNPAANSKSDCSGQFPYQPEKFIQKLLSVANEPNSDSVHEKFQSEFNVKLHATPIKEEPQSFNYDATGCEWYAHVLIARSISPKDSEGVRVLLMVGDLMSLLYFTDSGESNCLSIKVADRLLASSGWKGLRGAAIIASWKYRKGATEIDFNVLTERKTGSLCVSEVSVIYN